MNKKGFTLVEILAVIVILSLIITIVATNGFGAFNNAKNKINETTENEIKEAAKIFLTDIEHCDEELNQDILKKLSKNNCDELQNKAKTTNGCINITLQQLKELNYVSSKAVDDVLNENNTITITACLNGSNKIVTINE